MCVPDCIEVVMPVLSHFTNKHFNCMHAYISRNLCMEKIIQIINPRTIRQAITQKYFNSRITKSNVMYVSEEND